MYCLWKTGGAYLLPWKDDLQIGGVLKDNTLYIAITSASDWKGKVMFDKKRHSEYMHLPLDWPRINQFPEYFTVEKEKIYTLSASNALKDKVINGDELRDGFPVRIRKGETLKLIIR
jgi:hypothetical protein